MPYTSITNGNKILILQSRIPCLVLYLLVSPSKDCTNSTSNISNLKNFPLRYLPLPAHYILARFICTWHNFSLICQEMTSVTSPVRQLCFCMPWWFQETNCIHEIIQRGYFDSSFAPVLFPHEFKCVTILTKARFSDKVILSQKSHQFHTQRILT